MALGYDMTAASRKNNLAGENKQKEKNPQHCLEGHNFILTADHYMQE